MNTAGILCIILAGGQGKRMASADTHKVCFPIAGIPAIVRAVDTYKQAGIREFLVVVGQMAGQVMATLAASHPEITFVYQAEPRGTGHAALVAAEALAARGFHGPVMITMGDKVTRPAVVQALLECYAAGRPDALVTTLPRDQETSAGRVLERAPGQALAIVEAPDIRRARADGVPLCIGGQIFTADQVEQQAATVNASLYLFDFDRLHGALRRLSPGNAQGELYLTDTVEFLAEHGARVATHVVPDARDLMAFNTPAELLEIERVIRERVGAPTVAVRPEESLGPGILRPGREWLAALEQPGADLRRTFRDTYGADSDAIEERRQALLELARAFVAQFGPDRPMVLCRAPGRINLMGRHVDHRGGHVNVMAINREALLAAAPREDDLVRLRHLDVTRFPNREFHVFDLLRDETWPDWMDFLESHSARRVLAAAPGDWSHYARAPLLRLQYQCRHTTPLRGMDCMVSGNIPMGAGLSSSSALVVAFAVAAVGLNGLDLTMREFVDFCGEGEWFVGSRGGSADHAAIRTSQLGRISRLGFFPFRAAGDVTFPDELRLVIAHSGASAVKSAGARDTFNHRVAAYGFAQMILRRRWPAAAGMEHLRDLVPHRLGVQDADLFRALCLLPARPTRTQLRGLLPEDDHPRMEQIFATHANLAPYDLRGVTLFGLGECLRGERFAEVLEKRDLDAVARFMRASHDGDRRFRHAADGTASRFRVCTDDRCLNRLADMDAPLIDQCGRYACSTAAIDRLVDIANATRGVIGAQLAGAGLGGCMMILVRRTACDRLLNRLRRQFYDPNHLPFGAMICHPVAGAGLLSLGRGRSPATIGLAPMER
ncbi:MAG: NTP transferase domain-containing protein [Lentisphaeria bacterium]|nr:NTP transferase domain-containing protein [Lentisphaeria bacterium]